MNSGPVLYPEEDLLRVQWSPGPRLTDNEEEARRIVDEMTGELLGIIASHRLHPRTLDYFVASFRSSVLAAIEICGLRWDDPHPADPRETWGEFVRRMVRRAGHDLNARFDRTARPVTRRELFDEFANTAKAHKCPPRDGVRSPEDGRVYVMAQWCSFLLGPRPPSDEG